MPIKNNIANSKQNGSKTIEQYQGLQNALPKMVIVDNFYSLPVICMVLVAGLDKFSLLFFLKYSAFFAHFFRISQKAV